MNSIYKQLDKIDDSKSLNEKWNVKNQRELKKLKESLNEDADLKQELIELVEQYICSNYSCADLQIDVRDSIIFVEVWTEDGEYDDYDYDDVYDDSPNFTATLDIEQLIKLKNDIDAFETYVEDNISGYNGDSNDEDFYDRAAKELESHFNCTGAFLEPSTQLGRGKTFLFADDMEFEGSFDFQAGESYIRSNNFEGFLELCKNSFTVVTDESLNESDTAVEGSITIEKVKELVSRMKNELPYGFLTVSESAVRYMWEEMDGVDYATLEDLVVAINTDSEALEYVEEEPFGLIDYFTEHTSIHHAFEIEEFVENVKRLNVKYFGTEVVDDVDKEFAEASNSTLELFNEKYNVEDIKDVMNLHESTTEDLYRVDIFSYNHSRMNPKPHSMQLNPRKFNTLDGALEFFYSVTKPDQLEYTFLKNTADSCVEYVRIISPKGTLEKEWYHPTWGSHNQPKSRGKLKKTDVTRYLKSHQEVELTVNEFNYIVDDLWNAIQREIGEGSVYNTIEDVNMIELIDGSDNPTHDLCYKLMGLQ